MPIISIPYANDSPLFISAEADGTNGYKFSFHVGSCKGETPEQVLKRIAVDILNKVPS